MSILPGVPAVPSPTEQVHTLDAVPDEACKTSHDSAHPAVRQRLWGLDARLDASVTFEEFTYWAKVEREMEEEERRRHKTLTAGRSTFGSLTMLFTRSFYNDVKKQADEPRTFQSAGEHTQRTDEKMGKSIENNEVAIPGGLASTHEFDADWRQATRSLRTVGWGNIFYLITTDILGWTQTPYVFSNTGYGLGVGIFVLMGIAAGASGWMIFRTFIGLDSSRYPVLSFGDVFFRLFGPKTRHFINVMQALQMFLSVAVVLLSQTSILAQIAGSVDLCYIVCAIIVLVVGMASGFIRSLKQLGWFCQASVWLNVVTFIIICVAAAKFGPDPVAAVNNGILPKEWALPGQMAPVAVFIDTPPPIYRPTNRDPFASKFNGINSVVYAFSGAILFVVYLSEMRHPMDFWKAVLLAQTFITVVYVFFGAFGYTYYGQYSFIGINQVVKPLGLQIVGNVLSLLTGWLSVFLYFHVGMKTVYLEVGQELCGLPPITSSKGKILWWALGPIYWILAFVVCMSVPQFITFASFVGGLFSLNFTYSFAGVMFVAYMVRDGARLSGEGFDPTTGVTIRYDQGFKRWTRGFLKNWYVCVPVTIFSGCGLAASGMGTWAAVLGLEAAYGPGGSVLTSWTCTNPFFVPFSSSS